MSTLSFEIRKLYYNKRDGNLTVKASSSVKSNKFFPTYTINGKNYIFKPLSKTKPLTTTMFSYAEVTLSYLIDKYFCYAPAYQLAICKGYEENEGKYYDNGCLVENILGENEHLVNLYEFFRDNKDDLVDIDDYVNYCMMFYDYTNILKSKFFVEHPQLARKLALQILISILCANQNYHYENIAFVCDKDNNVLDLAAPIDHEFSTYFLFPETIEKNKLYFIEFLEELIDEEKTLRKNIDFIKKYYPKVVNDFIVGLEKLSLNIKEIVFEDFGFTQKGNSFGYLAGQARYKENNEWDAQVYEYVYPPKDFSIEEMNGIFIDEISKTINVLLSILKS